MGWIYGNENVLIMNIFGFVIIKDLKFGYVYDYKKFIVIVSLFFCGKILDVVLNVIILIYLIFIFIE